MEAEHFNGLDEGDFDVDDGEDRPKDDTSGDSADAADTAEKDEMHGTRRRRML